jgi:hypothetical protein
MFIPAAHTSPQVVRIYAFVVELLPVSGCSYSVALGTYGYAAVGVSSNSPIHVKPDMTVAWDGEQELIPTVWMYPGTLNSPYTLTGGKAAAPGNSVLYGVAGTSSNAGYFSGTTFNSDGTTQGFLEANGKEVTFTSSGVNSYGFGIVDTGLAGVGATGWALNGGVQCPCCYMGSTLTSSPGLYYLGATGVAGSGYRCSSCDVKNGQIYVSGTADGDATYWYGNASGFAQYSLPVGGSTQGYALSLNRAGTVNGEGISPMVGADTNPSSYYSFYSNSPFSSTAEAIPGAAYGAVAGRTGYPAPVYVGATPSPFAPATASTAAFLSTYYPTTLYAWLQSQGEHVMGTSNFKSMQVAFDCSETPVCSSGTTLNFVAVGLGNGTYDATAGYWTSSGTSEVGFAVFFL